MKSCSTKDCNNEVLCKGMCSKCYYRVKRGGTPELSKKQALALRTCEIEGCTKRHKVGGRCGMHYAQLLRSQQSPAQRQRATQTAKQWRAANPKKLAQQQQGYYKRNKARLSAYRAAWKKANKESYNAYLATRKKRVRQATPPWVDKDALRDFYMNCPEGYHVDHIIPLSNELVSGLNCLTNLQYLPADQNEFKNNKWDGTYENNSWRLDWNQPK